MSSDEEEKENKDEQDEDDLPSTGTERDISSEYGTVKKKHLKIKPTDKEQIVIAHETPYEKVKDSKLIKKKRKKKKITKTA
jgi:hypothetical protein